MTTENGNKTKALAPVDEVRGALLKMEGQFKMALPPQVTPEKFLRVAMTAIQLRPELLSVDRPSLYGAFMQAAQDGLLPDGREGTINTYAGKAKWLPMVGGICKKARNSGEIKTMNSKVVYMKDEWKAWTDETGEHFRHVEADGERGAPRLTYAYAITKDGGFYLEIVGEEQMAAIEAASAAKGGPWKGPFRDEMKRKSALKRLAKYRLPSSTDLEDVIRRDDDIYEFDKPATTAPTPAKTTRLDKVIDAAPAPAVVPEVVDPGSAQEPVEGVPI